MIGGECLGERTSQVTGEVHLLEESVNTLNDVILKLEERIVPVVKPRPPRGEGLPREAKAESLLVPHAEKLRSIREKINGITANAKELISCIEL